MHCQRLQARTKLLLVVSLARRRRVRLRCVDVAWRVLARAARLHQRASRLHAGCGHRMRMQAVLTTSWQQWLLSLARASPVRCKQRPLRCFLAHEEVASWKLTLHAMDCWRRATTCAREEHRVAAELRKKTIWKACYRRSLDTPWRIRQGCGQRCSMVLVCWSRWRRHVQGRGASATDCSKPGRAACQSADRIAEQRVELLREQASPCRLAQASRRASLLQARRLMVLHEAGLEGAVPAPDIDVAGHDLLLGLRSYEAATGALTR